MTLPHSVTLDLEAMQIHQKENAKIEPSIPPIRTMLAEKKNVNEAKP